MERYEEEVGLLGVECAVRRAQQLLVQHHIDAIPMVTRPVAPAEGAHPASEAWRHVVHVDPWPKACGRRCRPERRSAPERAVGAVDARLALAKVGDARALPRAVVEALVQMSMLVHPEVTLGPRPTGEAAALGYALVEAFLEIVLTPARLTIRLLRVELVRQLHRQDAVP